MSAQHSPKHAAPAKKPRRPHAHVIAAILALVTVAAVVGVKLGWRQPASPATDTKGEAASAALAQQAMGGSAVYGSAQTGSSQAVSLQGSAAVAPSTQPKTSSPAQTFQPVDVNLMMIGDVLLHTGVNNTAYAQGNGSYNYDFVFNDIRDEIDAADVAILNQETVCGDPANGYGYLGMGLQGPIFNSPVTIVDAEARAGFDVILKANNHTYDQGLSGLGYEMDYWRNKYPDLPVIGADNPNNPGGAQDYVHNIYMYQKDGFKVAFLSYTYDTNEYPAPSHNGDYIRYMTEDNVRADVAAARAAGADAIVACPHWGMQYTTELSAEEQRFSALFAQLDVDVVFGTHPHMDQTAQVIQNDDGHKTVCFYSNGNFVAGDMDGYKNIAGISKATLHRAEDGGVSVTAASFVPTVICRGGQISVHKLANYTDALAASSADPQITPAAADAFCEQLFGSQYDVSTHVATLDLDSTVPVAEKAALG